MAEIYAGDFQHKRSMGSSITYQVALFKDEGPSSPTRAGEDDIPLCGKPADAYFEVSGFGRFAKMTPLPTTAELTIVPSLRADAKNEMDELRKLLKPLVNASMDENKYVQKYYGVSCKWGTSGLPSACYILTEWCEGLPLDEVMVKLGQRPTDYAIVRCAAQVLEGLQFLHDNQIIHQDIKGANIIVSSSGKTLKITGLTRAKHFTGSCTPPRYIESATGTVPFASPEMVALSVSTSNHATHVGRKTDIWSLGCVMVQMLNQGQPPRLTDGDYERKDAKSPHPSNFKEIHRLFLMGCRPHFTLKNDSILKPILGGCLAMDPDRRLLTRQLISLIHDLYYFLFCKITPVRQQTEMQRFRVERYNLLRIPEEPTPAEPAEPNSLIPRFFGNDDNVDERLKNMTLPEMVTKSVQPDWVSIISPVRDDDAQQQTLLENKHKVFELLIKFASQTKYIIHHYAVKPENPTTELRVFTVVEDTYMLLSTRITLRIFQREMISGFTGQILEGLAFLHQNGIIHKDIRCCNIYVDRDIVKIAHFEKAAFHHKDSMLGTSITYPEGSSQFASKEMQELLAFDGSRRAGPVGPATDVFSLGCTVLEMYARKAPAWVYDNADKTSEKYKFLSGDRTEGEFVRHLYELWQRQAMPDVSGIIPEAAEKARDFVHACFMPSSDRSPCDLLKLHPFIRPPLPSQWIS
ncbi:dual specificity protein kinase zak2-like [Paramacrobiotus metropolitanus]|uniref:dual specificity protein kinase zak2-like n=1 Tax=Paramacrobiotus metropolitanus TaxID=2943436 RepID=UPI002446002F|nr:dual specificity protein kinase zak2-like [Paramacrobiotus metropolitanus]